MRRLGFAFALAVVALLRVYAIASAHVTLVSSDPAANSSIAANPPALRLEFSEPLDAKLAHVSLIGANGAATVLSVSNDPRNAYVILAPLSSLAGGAYRVSWHVVSADGHPVNGSFVFTIGAATAPPPEVPTGNTSAAWGPSIAGAPAIPAMLRGLGVGSLAALGGLLFFIVMLRAGFDSRPTRVAVWLAVAAAVLLGAHLATWLVNTAPNHRLSVEHVSDAFGTTVGRVELWRTLAALLPLWALVLVRRPGLALMLTLPALCLSAAVGHSAAFRPMASIPLKALHLFALAAWLGGLLWLVTRERNDMRRFAEETTRVSSIALVGIVVIAVSGVVQTIVLVPSLGALDSAYGTIVGLKVLGVFVLAGFGVFHRFRVMPRLLSGDRSSTAERFTGSLRREIAVIWIVVVLGGFLAYTSPPTAATSSQPSHSESTQ